MQKLIGVKFWRLFSKAEKLVRENLELEANKVTSDELCCKLLQLREFLKKATETAIEIDHAKIEDEKVFNVFIGRKVLIPLSGGMCVFNTGHNKLLSSESQRHEEKT